MGSGTWFSQKLKDTKTCPMKNTDLIRTSTLFATFHPGVPNQYLQLFTVITKVTQISISHINFTKTIYS